VSLLATLSHRLEPHKQCRHPSPHHEQGRIQEQRISSVEAGVPHRQDKESFLAEEYADIGAIDKSDGNAKRCFGRREGDDDIGKGDLRLSRDPYRAPFGMREINADGSAELAGASTTTPCEGPAKDRACRETIAPGQFSAWATSSVFLSYLVGDALGPLRRLAEGLTLLPGPMRARRALKTPQMQPQDDGTL
jgi:hypothetical protein